MKKAFLYCAVALSFFLASSALAGETPEDCLAGIQRAVDGNDPGLFEKYVDMHGITSQGVDLFVRDFKAHPPGGEGDPLLEMLAASLDEQTSGQNARSMKLLLAGEFRGFVLRNIAAGNFSGNPSGQSAQPGGGVFSALFTDVSTARKELRDMRVLQNSGETAQASARMYDSGSEQSYPLNLRLTARPEGFWQVTDVTNMADLIRMVRSEGER